jgi:hypothetical protein
VGVIIEFLHLWDILSSFELQPEASDSHFWRLTANGQYSTKVAYEGLSLVFGKPGRRLSVASSYD